MNRESEAERRGRRRLAPFWVPLLFGLLSLSNMIGRPSFATIRGADAVQLLGTGMCFGVALAALVGLLRSRPK
jgi:hypothetical protein